MIHSEDVATVCRIRDPRITESSGLARVGRVLVTTNDSGDAPRVFALDPRTCRVIGVTTYSGAAVDTEALAPAGGSRVWVGDLGDNLAQHPYVTLRRVPVAPGNRSVQASAYRLTYPDGPRDAEALVAAAGRLWVIDKSYEQTTVFAVPRRLHQVGTNRLRRVRTLPFTLVTDAAALGPTRAVVRGYASAQVFRLPSWRAAGGPFALPGQEQGEAVARQGRDTLLLSSEGENQPLLRLTIPGPRAPERRPEALPDPPADRQPWYLGGGAAAILLLLGIAALLRRGRRRSAG